MNCQKCSSDRIVSINAKCSDCCFTRYQHYETDGYVPSEFGVGGGDYIELELCIECGTVQGSFPLPEPEEFIEECGGIEDDDSGDDLDGEDDDEE